MSNEIVKLSKLSKRRLIPVILHRKDGEVPIYISSLSLATMDSIEETLPSPSAPLIEADGGKKISNINDAGYVKDLKQNNVEQSTMMVALAMDNQHFEGDDLDSWMREVREQFDYAEIATLCAAVFRSISAATEEKLEEAADTVRPIP